MLSSCILLLSYADLSTCLDVSVTHSLVIYIPMVAGLFIVDMEIGICSTTYSNIPLSCLVATQFCWPCSDFALLYIYIYIYVTMF